MRPTANALAQTAAVSVAAVLGTGILGLPVALHASGLRPFLLLFTANLVAQLGVAAAAADVLQRAFHAPQPRGYLAVVSAPTPSPPPSPPPPPPSLHALATRFVPHAAARHFFGFVVMAHFLFILSAYAIAGPQALAALVPPLRDLPVRALQAIFVVVSALLIVLTHERLLPALSLAVVAKAALLTALVSLALARGLAIRQPVTDSWKVSNLVDPFLMGTIALSGVVNLMPVTFQKCLQSLPPDADSPVNKDFISAYRNATFVAIVICYVLNVSWCLAVLFVVPQTAPLSLTHQLVHPASVPPPCATLYQAYQNGEISTIPLIDVLKCRHDHLDTVISFVVNLFIAVSVTVSFLVMSMGMKHYIDGIASDTTDSDADYNRSRFIRYVVYFSVVLLTALLNPQGVFRIMEGITTLALNIEAGVYILYMLYQSRKEDEYCAVPAPLSSLHVSLIYAYVGIYFFLVVSVDTFYYLPTTLLKR